jgi:hypothetical protein
VEILNQEKHHKKGSCNGDGTTLYVDQKVVSVNTMKKCWSEGISSTEWEAGCASGMVWMYETTVKPLAPVVSFKVRC